LNRHIAEQERISVQLQESKDHFRHAAFHDALTHLPNRALLTENLKFVIERAKNTKTINSRCCSSTWIDSKRERQPGPLDRRSAIDRDGPSLREFVFVKLTSSRDLAAMNLQSCSTASERGRSTTWRAAFRRSSLHLLIERPRSIPPRRVSA